jgi:hypothetical protein
LVEAQRRQQPRGGRSIGDASERMGAHYTRHVEAEQNIIRAFSRIKDRQDKA